MKPETIIPWKALIHTLRLGGNARELAQHVAMGPGMTIPANQAEMTTAQAGIFSAVLSALARWTITMAA